MNKILCIITVGGGHFHFRTTEENWGQLTQGAKVWMGGMVSGWELNQAAVNDIIMEAYPAREQYQRIPVIVASERKSKDHPHYFIVYSPIDKPEVHRR